MASLHSQHGATLESELVCTPQQPLSAKDKVIRNVGRQPWSMTHVWDLQNLEPSRGLQPMKLVLLEGGTQLSHSTSTPATKPLTCGGAGGSVGCVSNMCTQELPFLSWAVPVEDPMAVWSRAWHPTPAPPPTHDVNLSK